MRAGMTGGASAGARRAPPVDEGSVRSRPTTSADGDALRVRPATLADDAALRALLREGDMAGPIRLAMEREPSYFASLNVEALRHDTVILEDSGDGSVVAMGARTVHAVTLAGEGARLGYLGQLRTARGRRLGRTALREGWARLLEARRPDELPFDLTSIAADNRVARRLLERGLPGLPRYHPVTEYEVLAIPTGAWGPRGSGVEVRDADADDRARMEELFRAATDGAALVLPWSPPAGRGARPAAEGRPTREPRDATEPSPATGVGPAPGAVWHLAAVDPTVGVVAGLSVVDPTPWRQYVIRGYEGPLRWSRPLANLVLRCARSPLLPPPGSPLRCAFLMGVCSRPSHEDAVAALLREAARRARRRGIAVLLYGAPRGDPWARLLGRWYRPRRYRTIHYLVARQDPGPVLERLRTGPLHVEALAL
jgi:hypothetical protein